MGIHYCRLFCSFSFTLASLSFATLMISETAQSSPESLRQQLKSYGITSLSSVQPFKESAEIILLGKNLYFDKILSGNKDISCATCHHPSLGSSDLLPLPLGTGGRGLGQERTLGRGHVIPRNAPAAFNGGLPGFDVTMWDGRISRDPATGALNTPEPALNGVNPRQSEMVAQLKTAFAAQAMFPVTSHHEMRGEAGSNEIADAENNLQVWQRLMARLVGTENGQNGGVEAYRQLFQAAYPEVENYDQMTFAHAARAIAAFESVSFVSSQSALDRFLDGEEGALSVEAMAGADLFVGKANCVACHSGSHLTDFGFHSLATPQLGPGKEAGGDDRGLAAITGLRKDLYKFKTPTLRNVAVTGPWMHSGAYNRLEDVILHHANPAQKIEDFYQQPAMYLAGPVEDFTRWIDFSETRREARLATIDADLKPLSLSAQEVLQLKVFLHSLTDTSFVERTPVPEHVASGLPVRD